MSLKSEDKNLSFCEKIRTEQLINTIKILLKQIFEFHESFAEFIKQQKKLSNELWNDVTRYNILNNELPCVYPIITKEELLEELLVAIQENTSRVKEALNEMKEKFDKLPKSNEVAQHQSDQTDWNPVTNFSIKGTTNHKAPSEYLEDITDILYQYDIAITCMQHYFDALDIRDSSSYQNFMNSFGITRELSDFVDEMRINVLTLIK